MVIVRFLNLSFRIRLNSHGNEAEVVSVAGNVPFGNLVGINLDALGGKFTAKPGKYFVSDPEVKVTASILRARSCLACCCGGMPPIVQRVQGLGYAFLQGPNVCTTLLRFAEPGFMLLNAYCMPGGGSVMAKVLQPGETMVIDHRYIVGYTESMDIDVKQVGNCITCCCAGEGCYNTVLTGKFLFPFATSFFVVVNSTPDSPHLLFPNFFLTVYLHPLQGPGVVYMESYGPERMIDAVRKHGNRELTAGAVCGAIFGAATSV